MRPAKFRIAMIPSSTDGVNYYRLAMWAFEMRKYKNVLVDLLWFKYEIDPSRPHPWQEDFRSDEPATQCPGLTIGQQIYAEIDHACELADIVVWHPMYHPWSLDFFLEMQHKHQKPFVVEVDDNYVDVPPWNEAFNGFRNGSPFRSVSLDCMRNADALFVSTPHLGQTYAHINDEIYIIENSLDFKGDRKFVGWDTVSVRKHRGIRIGWIGGRAHFDDLMLVAPMLREFLKEHRNVTFCLINSALRQSCELLDRPYPFDGLKNVMYADRSVPINRYAQFAASFGFEIGIAPLIDCNFNRSKCVTGDTRIITSKGIKRIEMVSNHRIAEEFTPIQDEKFSSFFYGGVQKIIRIKTVMGYEIAGTTTHRVMNEKNEWVSLIDVKPGERLKIDSFTYPEIPYQKVKFPLWLTYRVDYKNANLTGGMMPEITINEDWGRFLGYVIGDGHLSKANQLGISCSTDYPDIIEDVKRLYRSMSLNPYEVKKWSPHGNVKVITKGVDVKTTSNHMLAFLRHLNIESRSYMNTKNLKIPEIIWSSPKSVIKEFIRAVFETDGTVSAYGSRASFTSKSHRLAMDVQFALLGFGIASSLKARWNKSYSRYYYTLSLSRWACDIFAREIGFISEKKSKELNEITRKNHSNRYEPFSWTDVVETKSTETEDHVYDINVPITHLYNGNGFVSHNSNLRWIEYSALKIPTIATGISHFSQSIDHGETGFLIKDNDIETWKSTLELLVENPVIREQVGRNAYQRVKKDFNVQRNSPKYLRLLKKLAGMAIEEDRELIGVGVGG